jgi:ATP-dependent exoDNAse (exonuclease V) beta subunit
MESNKKFKVYRAGAGSGKTFQLIRQLLSLALSTSQVDYYKHILAITFTNAAAHEMRKRFIESLEQFATEDLKKLEQEALFQLVCEYGGVSGRVIQDRAQLTFRHVLHNYDLLSIGTIDSFAQKLVRSFAFELNLSGDFKLELEMDDFYERVVDSCLDEVGLDPELTQYLVFLVQESLDDERSWKAQNILSKYANHLKSESAQEAASALMEASSDYFTKARVIALQHARRLTEERIQTAKEALAILSTYSTDINDYPGKSTGYFSTLKKMANGDVPNSFAKLKGVQSSSEFYGPKPAYQPSPSDQAKLEVLITNAVSHLEGPKAAEFELYHKIAEQILGLGLLKMLAREAEILREEDSVLLIGDLHQRVHNVLREQSSPFLFERLGIKYKHILIDEFQDTSVVQWSNMLPLYTNALSENHETMVVGDAKQSIYRFRGGYVRQFVDLPNVPTQPMNALEAGLFKAAFDEKFLEHNRRSDEVIVSFNNQLYPQLAPSLESLSEVYHKMEQTAVKKGNGYVTAQQIPKDQMVDSAVRLVKEAMDAHFRPEDIAILVLRKKDGYEITERLIAEGIRVQSEESLLLHNSHKVRFLEAWLQYLERPNNQEAILAMIAQLGRDGREISIQQFCQTMQHHQWTFANTMEQMVQPIWPTLFETTCEDVYDEASRVVALMQWEMDVFIEFYLNELFQKTRNEFFSRHKWNTWWKAKRDKLSIKVGSDPMAVRMMTVHKSKGLEFPVVIFCAFVPRNETHEEWYRMPPNDCSVERLFLRVSRRNASKKNPLFEANEDLQRQNNTFVEELDLDALNVRYVATTRAKSCLHLLVGDTKADSPYWQAISQTPGGQQVGDILQWGAPVKEIERLPVQRAEAPRLFLGTALTDPSTEPTSIKHPSQMWGDFVHQCLARIRVHDDLPRALDRTYAPLKHASWMSKEELSKHLKSLLHQPQVAPWFEDCESVWIEHDIYLPNGQVIRPDRVIRNEKGIAVIDYKTGKKDELHRSQVSQYMHALSSMYPAMSITGHLWYLETNEVQTIGL